jgi:hypothetical protein
MHLPAGLDDGLNRSDVEEVLLQADVYAGADAAGSFDMSGRDLRGASWQRKARI